MSDLLNTMSGVLLSTGTTGGSSGGFDLIQFFKNIAGYLKDIGKYIIILAGVILIIVAIVQIAKGFAAGGKGQVNWVMSIACLLVGGMLLAGGWTLAANVASMGKDTIEELGTGTYESEADENGDSSVSGFGATS